MSSWTEYKKRKRESRDGEGTTTVSSWQQYKAKKQQEAEASGEVSYNTRLSQRLQTRAITDAVNRQYVAYHAEENRAKTYAENRQKREAEREASQIASRIDNSIQRGGQLDLPTLRYRIDELDRSLMDPASGYNQSIPASALRTEADYLKSIRQDIMDNARAEWDAAEAARNEERDSNRYASAAQKAQEAKAQWQYLYATLQGGDLDQAEREYNDAVQKARNYFGVDLEYQAQLEEDAREKQLIYESIRDYRSSAEVDQAKARKDAAQREYERLFAETTSMDVAGTLTPEAESALKAAKDRVKKADDEYNRLYNEYFGAASPARYAGTIVGKGLASILNRATATVSFINQYNPLMPEYNKQASFAAHNKTTDWLNNISYEAGRAATAMGPSEGWQWASDASASLVEQIPYIILSVVTGGSSAAAGAASSVGKQGAANAIKNAVLAMAKDPSTYLTAFMTMGSSYEQAINAGASDFQAASFGVVDALVASVIERGFDDDASGIQGIPRMVKEAAETGNNVFLKELMKGFLDEGKEEILQDVISGLTRYAIYGWDTGMTFASVEDEDAALNPVRALESGLMGAAVGGVGGAFTGAGSSLDAWLRNNAPATVEQYAREADAVFQTEGGLKAFVDYGLKADTDSEVFQRANALQSLDASQVTDREVAALYRAVLSDMEANAQTEVEPTAEEIRAMSAAQQVNEIVSRGTETTNRYDLQASRSEVSENLASLGIDEKTASQLADTYQANTDINPTDYALEVESAYRAGRADAPLNALDAQRISPDVQAKAYEAGRASAGQRPTILRSNGGKGRVVMQTRSALTERQETSVAALKKISQALGVNFYVFESELGEDGQRVGDNGYYDRDGIHIDIHAGANGDGLMLFTVAHELTHFIKDQAPVEFKKLAEFLFDNYKAADISVDELINRQIQKASAQGRNISYDIAYEEVVADSMETMLADGSVVERLADLKTKDRGLWEKIRDFFKQLAERIHKVYEGLSPDSVEGYYVSQMVDSIDQIQNLFTEGLAAAGENYQANNDSDPDAGGKKNPQFGENAGGIDAVFSLRGVNKYGIEVYETSEDIRSMGLADRRALYLDILKNEYRGRTAKFIRNGHAFYAKFDRRSIRKHIYGDSRSNPNGVKALIDAGADGDVFDLVERSRYSRSAPNRKNHTKADYFDYFVKTVQIDGKVFDLIADIEKKYGDGDGYLYTIALLENKKIKASPALGTPTSGPVKGAGNALESSVTDIDGSVKPSSRDSSISNRTILANALMSVAQTDEEARMLQEYKDNVSKMEELDEALSAAKARLKEVMFAKGPRDTGMIASLNAEIRKTTNRLNAYDRALIKLETAAPLRKLIARERDVAIRRVRESYQESRAKNVEGRKRTLLRGKIKRVVSDLNQMLQSGTREKHVPIQLQKPVAEVLSLINMDTVGADERVANYDALIAAETDPQKIAELKATRDRIWVMGDNLAQKLAVLKTAYDEIKKSPDPDVQAGYDENIAELMEQVKSDVGDTSLRNMTEAQLQQVYDLFKAVRATVRNANRSFVESRRQTIDALGASVTEEIGKIGGYNEYTSANKTVEDIKTFRWNNQIPIYAMRKIGSDTFMRLYRKLADAQGVWADDIYEARAFYEAQAEKYGAFEWDTKETFEKEFTASNERNFRLTLGQAMGLYALSKRDYARNHLSMGGFVHSADVSHKVDGEDVNLNPTANYVVDAAVIRQVMEALTPEQIQFVDAMQEYLSKTMGAKGNEVSMRMYEIKLFGEENYYPMQVSPRTRPVTLDGDETVFQIKNYGFTRKPNPNASTSLVLGDFMDVWANHVNQMSSYHAFVLPMEDFTRVFNWGMSGSGINNTGVRNALVSAYGQQAETYISQLLKDINGGVRLDSRERLGRSLVAKLRKTSTMLSLSVTIQQPSSIDRAKAYIADRFFLSFQPSDANVRRSWAELKKYAPIAKIKEMGHFDVGMGASTREFLRAKSYHGFRENLSGILEDSTKRDEFLTRPAAFMDEVTWCTIWNAVKRETQANTKLDPGSEEFLQRCGERFTEVVELTQVYDSVFARSGYMRDKRGVVSQYTAFMAEPTLTMNMVQDAVLTAQRGDKRQGAKAFGAAVRSVILNAVLVAGVYAARDDDEDETFAEKYAQAFAKSLMSGLNPLNYFPLLRDLVSIMEGYEIDRADMTLFSNLYNSSTRMIEAVYDWDDEDPDYWKTKLLPKVGDFVGDMGNFLGIPAKNVIRDMQAAIRGVSGIMNEISGANRVTVTGMQEAIRDVIPFADATRSGQIYRAYMRGDTAYADRLLALYKDESSANTAIQKALRSHEPRIKQAAQAYVDGDLEEYDRLIEEIAAEDHFDRNRIIGAAKSEISDLQPDVEEPYKDKAKAKYSSSDYLTSLSSNNYNNNQEIVRNIREDIISTYVANGKTEEDAEKLFSNNLKTALKDAFTAGTVSESNAKRVLRQEFDMSEDEAYWQIRKWSTGTDSSYATLRDSLWSGQGVDAAVKELTDHGYTSENVRTQVQNSLRDMYWGEYEGNKNRLSRTLVAQRLVKYAGKKQEEADQLINEWTSYVQTGIKYSEIKSLYMEGKLTASRAKQIYTKYGGLTQEEAEDKIQEFDFQKKYPDLELSAAGIRKYNQYAQPQGVSAEEFYDLWSYEKLSDTYQEDVIEYIDSLSLSSSQKDALFVSFYAQSSLYKCPW